MTEGAEAARLAAPTSTGWRRWGTYLAERAWGTVREDYSADGDAWSYLPYDHARSRAYRWSEDGLAGWSDDQQCVCLALALWNGNDPTLKERLFGLSSTEGNHGEDVKEQWWFLDNTPTHSYTRWRYRYPQSAFPYDDLLATNRARGRGDAEYEIADTGVFDHGSWNVEVEHAKPDPDSVVMLVTVRNDGPAAATLHVLPTVWFRNTWSWGNDVGHPQLYCGDADPRPGAAHDIVYGEHTAFGRFAVRSQPPAPTLFCDNDTNTGRLYGDPGPRYAKDGINDHVVSGADTTNPDQHGTKAAFHHRITLAPGASQTLTIVLSAAEAEAVDGAAMVALRRAEADEFYASLTPATASPTEVIVLRQAFAGLLWCKQLYHYNVDRWRTGDQWPAPRERLTGRNSGWRHFDAFDVMSMPDTWEYPWFASWDVAFHAVALAHLDPEFAKAQLVLLCREWYQHPNGNLPAYEWNFSDANPPVHAWAALQVFEIDGRRDHVFLARVFHKLLLNFTWWVNRMDTEGNNVFEGVFLGLDNIGLFDRSSPVPGGGVLEQADGTAWMAKYCLDMLAIALTLADHDPAYEDVATKFFEHFTYIATAAETLWQEDDGFFHDVLHFADGSDLALRYRSMVGLIPLTAVTVLSDDLRNRLSNFAFHMNWFEHHRPDYMRVVSHTTRPGRVGERLLSVVGPQRLSRLLETALSEDHFLSAYGLRSMSREHLDHPYLLALGGTQYRVDYEPGESRTGLFGGNSNWRGPVWFPINVLVIEALIRYHHYLGDDFTVELPTGSGVRVNLAEVSLDLSRRLIGLIRPNEDGAALFHEYFHGDTGAGLGADHQTGWTALVAHLILRIHSDVATTAAPLDD
ncbi:MAG: glucosidase [Acidimicrobiales bacterium]|nr:glucosidase [Acidimicrobiales bacterium]